MIEGDNMCEVFLRGKAYRLDKERSDRLECLLENSAEAVGTCSVHEIPEDRQEIFEMIQEERDYQDEKWGEAYDDEDWAINDWLEFIRRQIKQAHAYTGNNPAAMCCMRKIAALAVAAMEYYDTPSREEENAYREIRAAVRKMRRDAMHSRVGCCAPEGE